MKIFVAGSHGNVGKRLVKLLTEKGHSVKAMIRDESQTDEIKSLGAEPVVANLENDQDFPLENCDVVYFCAGSGAETGPEKTKEVDQKGAIRLINAADHYGANRFIMLSSIGADDPEHGPENLKPYLRAKNEADKELKYSGLTYTIIRPGHLTDDPGTGKVEADEQIKNHEGSISREDVAQLLAACIEHPRTENKVFEVISGNTPIDRALTNLPL